MEVPSTILEMQRWASWVLFLPTELTARGEKSQYPGNRIENNILWKGKFKVPQKNTSLAGSRSASWMKLHLIQDQNHKGDYKALCKWKKKSSFSPHLPHLSLLFHLWIPTGLTPSPTPLHPHWHMENYTASESRYCWKTWAYPPVMTFLNKNLENRAVTWRESLVESRGHVKRRKWRPQPLLARAAALVTIAVPWIWLLASVGLSKFLKPNTFFQNSAIYYSSLFGLSTSHTYFT